MWRFPDDNTESIITAREQLKSAHRECRLWLPSTAIMFFMSMGPQYLREKYGAVELPEPFPRFLNRCPLYRFIEYPICFLDGGRGAPQACDTVETLAALGVKNIIAVGMIGGFDPRLSLGEVIAPEKAFVEEGTSLHYYESIDCACPDKLLRSETAAQFGIKTFPIVTTDAVYRQTFYKERLWREKGAVGVDMETSAVFSVSRCLGLKSVAMLMVSDIHPIESGGPKWDWRMTQEMRFDLAEKGFESARMIAER